MADKKKNLVEAAAPASDKKKALETAMAQIEKAYGKGSIMRLGDNADIVVEAIPTGSLSLDLALGIGGLPKGRIIEVYGPESSGKTTVALQIIAQAQKLTGRAKISGILGGFHLLEDNERLHDTVDYLRSSELKMLYPAHCISLAAKAAMLKYLPITEVGVGLKIEL